MPRAKAKKAEKLVEVEFLDERGVSQKRSISASKAEAFLAKEEAKRKAIQKSRDFASGI